VKGRKRGRLLYRLSGSPWWRWYIAGALAYASVFVASFFVASLDEFLNRFGLIGACLFLVIVFIDYARHPNYGNEDDSN